MTTIEARFQRWYGNLLARKRRLDRETLEHETVAEALQAAFEAGVELGEREAEKGHECP